MPLKEMSVSEEYDLLHWMHYGAYKSKQVMFKQVYRAGITLGCEDALENVHIAEYEVLGLEVPGSLILYTDLDERIRLNRVICSGRVASFLENCGVLDFAKDVQEGPVKKIALSQAKLLKL